MTESRVIKGWYVELVGEEEDLRLLSNLLDGSKLSVTRWDSTYVLGSTMFSVTFDHHQVFEGSTRLIEIINGVVRLYSPQFSGVRPQRVIGIDDAGRRSGYVPLTLRSRSASMGIPTSAAEEALTLIRVAGQDPAVGRALALYGNLERNWRTLFMVFEVIRDDVGGERKLARMEWVPREKIDLFQDTAKSFLAVGGESKRPKKGRKGAPEPMSLLEARRILDRLLRKWLRSK